jgi:hypothetical protein
MKRIGLSKEKRLIFSLGKLAIVCAFNIFILGACKNTPSGPTPPTDLSQYYHLDVTYTRVAIRDTSSFALSIYSTSAELGIPYQTEPPFIEAVNLLTKIDDYNFKIPLSKNPFACGFYWIAVADYALYDGGDRGLIITGRTIKIRVEETNITYTLSHIVQSTAWYTANGPSSTMARFFLDKDGSIIDK